MSTRAFTNPFRPGAGHMPPYLAGRHPEREEFLRLLKQETILENMVLTGLRGVGKTVLLESLKPLAIKENWFWVGTDLSESTSVSEQNIAIRLCTDLAIVTSNIVIGSREIREIGFTGEIKITSRYLDYETLMAIYSATPGLASDKLKSVLEIAWKCLKGIASRGLIFAYDEAQNLSDQAAKEQYPLSLLLEVFQSIQKKSIPFMLALTGLPMLFPKLVETRTYSERMFRVLFLDHLSEDESKEAILKPIEDYQCPVKLNDSSVDIVIQYSGCYPYFIQFICREVYDAFLRNSDENKQMKIPIDGIIRKLDTDFFSGRWARATDRQRQLLSVIAQLDNCDLEFTVQEVVESSKIILEKPFTNSHVNQMLLKLSEAGLVYKNSHGKYAFAVPLLGRFIKRQLNQVIGINNSTSYT